MRDQNQMTRNQETDGGTGAKLLPSDTHVLKSHGAKAGRIQQVLSVDNDGPFHQVADLAEIKRAELGPSGADDESVHSFGNSVGGLAVLNGSVELRPRFRNRDRIIGPDARSLSQQVLRQLNRSGAGNRIRVRLESQSENADVFILHGVDGAGYFVEHALSKTHIDFAGCAQDLQVHAVLERESAERFHVTLGKDSAHARPRLEATRRNFLVKSEGQ